MAALTTYFSYLLLIAFGHIRDFCGKVTGYSRYFGGNDKPEKVCAGRCGAMRWRAPAAAACVAAGATCASQHLSCCHATATQGYAPLLHDWENFYTRRLYHRIQDAWNRPIRGPPSANAMKVVSRVSNDSNYTMKYVGCCAVPVLRGEPRGCPLPPAWLLVCPLAQHALASVPTGSVKATRSA